MAYHKLVNSIVGVWPRYKVFCLSSPMYQIRYNPLFYFARCVIHVSDQSGYAKVIGAVGALEHERRIRKRRKMAANNGWTGYETWAQAFLFSKCAP